MEIITICNQKGGVGKTTTAFNLGACLAKKGKNVLLVDLDPQGNLSSYCQFENEDGQKFTVADLIAAEISKDNNLGAEDIASAVQSYAVLQNQVTRDTIYIDYIPADITLSQAEVQLMNTMVGREHILSKILTKITDKYDYCIIDCLPSLGLLFTNALFASDKVIVPVQTQKFAKEGLSQLFRTIQDVQEYKVPPIEIVGIIPTMTENTNISKKVMQELQEQYEGKILPEIKKRVAAANASDSGIAVSGELGKAYMAIADIIVKDGE